MVRKQQMEAGAIIDMDEERERLHGVDEDGDSDDIDDEPAPRKSQTLAESPLDSSEELSEPKRKPAMRRAAPPKKRSRKECVCEGS